MYDTEIIMAYISLAIAKLMCNKMPITLTSLEIVLNNILSRYPNDEDIIAKYHEICRL